MKRRNPYAKAVTRKRPQVIPDKRDARMVVVVHREQVEQVQELLGSGYRVIENRPICKEKAKK